MKPRVSLPRAEDTRNEWKESAHGLKSEHLAAFANSDYGGVIWIGVRDDGMPIGAVLDDELRLLLGNRASSCHPPVAFDISTVICSGVEIVKVDIPPSDKRPHCSASGTYKIRRDGLSVPLHPSELLQLFVDRESARFENRFRKVVDDALSRIDTATETLLERIEDVRESVAEAAVVAERALAAQSDRD